VPVTPGDDVGHFLGIRRPHDSVCAAAQPSGSRAVVQVRGDGRGSGDIDVLRADYRYKRGDECHDEAA
jgi:hypothetical protein